MTVTPDLSTIRGCLEGIAPSFLATCDADGMPNVIEISQVQYVDSEHVALSYQFFNKTRANILTSHLASVVVFEPLTNAQYRLDLDYIETQTAGPLFETMRAKLAGIASHSGMTGIFKLLGADLFRVVGIEPIAATRLERPPRRNLLAAARAVLADLEPAADLEDLADRLLAALETHMAIAQAMLLVADRDQSILYTVASRGYADTGVGSEIAFGDGVIGVAASAGVPIRIGHMSADYNYGSAVRHAALRKARAEALSEDGLREIPFPGMAAPESQIALPIRQGGTLLGVLFAESAMQNAFSYEDEDALALVLGHVAPTISLMQLEDGGAGRVAPSTAVVETAERLRVRHYASDDSIFLGHDYLIKGVAGAILWMILREHSQTGRKEFTNRELRLNPALRLPEHAENLEARLVLLRRRLLDRGGAIRIDCAGRGRLRLEAPSRLELHQIADEDRKGVQ